MGGVGEDGDHVEVEGGAEVALGGVEEGRANPKEGEDPNQGLRCLLCEGEVTPEEMIKI